MGQKVHPYGFRLGISKDWKARWINEKNYKEYLLEDLKIRDYIKKTYHSAGVSDIFIERPEPGKVSITIKCARPGVIIGRKGSEVKKLRAGLERLINRKFQLNIEEVKTPETDALLVAEDIASRIEKRASYKRAMKRAIFTAMRKGAKGIKIMVSGRLNGAEIARTEWYLEGRLPLQTLKSDIDYGYTTALTKMGIIGVRVWIYKGDVAQKKATEA
ncbi:MULTISPECIES: 30S ribosomal protein S3 [Kosmotoga]|uniref:Small ribosomal subunit protein uS3 n=1 Tax=Kosmotoga olearia (strain ATCC BAA-1733 / DSM 21960 / TBF 19.5.1) TaxID=521045 RepID=RS3_KOSOT|nr:MULTISPECIES: 30S ribosomal protein S3 [Kosmotoga]C5CGQ8.1 RecName: Full=Small ribosomal subunit protein uS3; AltName: Full=30S ribosomal protein S3 [Kosmotoga olearia TBF 19.5.1]ACR80577.1 ribosomal protein S3 [Kosmotoga olearia TBF 19.5.1]MDI3523292.1 small subunit ribosomal protein [Kosmotoga sp.]MDK2952778.1 small subunit ribosomal protein [Kosmotoga sp.]OAA19445.1 30S ribosomal protein S3 [Kosmotoga sp. DU53]